MSASVRETQTPSTSTNRYIRRKDSRTEASAISTRSCSPRTSTWLPGFDCLVDRNLSRIAKFGELTILLFAGAICFLFFPSKLWLIFIRQGDSSLLTPLEIIKFKYLIIMSHHNYPPTSPRFGVFSGREIPEHSSIQDRLHIAENVNSDHVGGSGTKHHYQAPSPNVDALQVSSQSEARTTFNLQGYPSSPRRPLPSPRPQPSPRFPQRDRFGEELDRASNGSSNSGGSGSGQHLKSPFYHQPGTPTSVSQNQLERLAVEASNVAGGILGTRHTAPEPFQRETGYHSASRSLSGGSNISVTGPSRDRLQALFSVPESASTGTSPLPSPSMLPQQFSRSLPRTSSIDSAISTVSAHSLGNSNNHGNTAPTPADIQTLIQAAGSAEALIGYMLKEKASAATQNAQLWKLVDKQRAMILGLNKDLERVLKDKDRYRKKLKEHLGVVPPIPTSTSAASLLAAGIVNESSGTEDHNEAPEETYSLTRAESMPLLERQRRGSDLGSDSSLPQYPVTLIGNNSDDPRTQANSPEERISSPTAHNRSFTPESVKTPMGSQHSDSSSYPERGGNVPLSPKKELAEELHTPRTSVELSDNRPLISEMNPAMSLDSAKAAARHHLLKSLGILTSVAPVSGLGKSPLRKAPPAPLALSPLTETRLHTDDEDYEDDDDDDDDVSIDEIVGYQKKTEGLVIVTEDRSSEDYDRRNSWEHTPIDKKGPEIPFPQVESSVGQAGPQHLVKKGLNLAPPPMLNGKPHSPGLGDGSGIRQQFARVPLPSPGLPSSPRPVDRPPNSPKPRMRPQSPESPRTTPLSPRLGVVPVPFQPSTPHRLMPQSVNMPMRSPLPLRSPLPRGHGKSDSSSSQQTSIDPLANLIILPSAIPSIDCRVVSSRMKPSRASMMPGSKPRISDSDSVFTLGVFARSTGNEILRVEKDVGALPALDVVLRKYIAYNVKVPDRALFTGHAPARIDSRRIAVDEYFAGVLGATMDERAAMALCEFFSTEVVDHVVGNSEAAGSIKEESSIASGVLGKTAKEGYLTKRGKNFGGWKARYFILDGPVLKYYEAPGGVHLGQIKLQSAQIGRQSQSQKVKEPLEGETDMESQYRHAFLILEPKRKDSSTLVRHVLCAESDAERDEWVDVLMQYVDKGDTAEELSQASQTGTASGRDKKKKRYGPNNKDSKDSQTIEQEKLHALGYEQTTPGPEPARGPTPEEFQRLRNTPSPQNSITSSIPASQSSASILAPSVVSTTDRGPQPKQISAPTNGSVISDLAAWGAKLTHSEQKAAKKRSIWGFRQRSSSADLECHHLQAHNGLGERLPMSRSIFGATLEEAVHLSKPFGVTVNLPAVVYRCIEYLEAKDASNEEGIFRLSGSNVVIKGLREKFNTGEHLLGLYMNQHGADSGKNRISIY